MRNAVVLGVALATCTACTMTDSEVEAAIAVQLAVDPSTTSYGLTVRIEGGVVQLDGATMTRAEQRRAVEIASSVPGVRDVQSNLRLLDEAIRDAVTDALRGDPIVGPLDITVAVEGGVTRLESGNTDAAQRQRAREIASRIDGVTRVDDFMR